MINSLQELIEKLKNTKSEDFPKVIKNIDISASEFIDYIHWSDESYTRNCIERTDRFELMLLCWNEKQDTPIHDHGGEQCWVYQVKGDVDEVRYEENKEGDLEVTDKMTLTPGKLTYMDDSMGYHSLENNNNEKALTLHLYMKPIDECEVYNNKTNEFENKEMAYDTYLGEFVDN